MIISDLQYLEIADQTVQGGKLGFADAYADAYAKGKYFAATFAATYTDVYIGKKYVYSSSSAVSSSSAS